MKLKVLSSNSKGNCYVLDNGAEALVIEAGVPLSEVKKAVDFDISRIVGCLISHEHSDHAKYADKFVQARIPVFASRGTIDALGSKGKGIESPGMAFAFEIGGFKVMQFPVKHDASEPWGFLIQHHEIGTLLFATDTYYLEYKFNGLTNILIECNHSNELLKQRFEDGKITDGQYNRALQSHMNFETCKKTLLANDLSQVNNIVLIHLSDGNSNAKEFQQGIAQATGKTVHIAEKGLEININKTPF